VQAPLKRPFKAVIRGILSHKECTPKAVSEALEKVSSISENELSIYLENLIKNLIRILGAKELADCHMAAANGLVTIFGNLLSNRRVEYSKELDFVCANVKGEIGAAKGLLDGLAFYMAKNDHDAHITKIKLNLRVVISCK
jgi:hypothetical protein